MLFFPTGEVVVEGGQRRVPGRGPLARQERVDQLIVRADVALEQLPGLDVSPLEERREHRPREQVGPPDEP